MDLVPDEVLERVNRRLTAMQEKRWDKFFIWPHGERRYPTEVGLQLEVIYPRPNEVGRAKVNLPGGYEELAEAWTEKLTQAWLANGMKRPDPARIPGTTDYGWADRR